MHVLYFKDEYDYSSSRDGITVPVNIAHGTESIDLIARIDTGAQYCIFERDYAECLGIIVETGELKQMSTATGASFSTYGHQVSLLVLGRQYDSIVYFAADRDLRRNVLGRQGWIQLVRLGIVDHDGRIYVSHYNENGIH